MKATLTIDVQTNPDGTIAQPMAGVVTVPVSVGTLGLAFTDEATLLEALQLGIEAAQPGTEFPDPVSPTASA